VIRFRSLYLVFALLHSNPSLTVLILGLGFVCSRLAEKINIARTQNKERLLKIELQ
jgi:hypothetical protein